jgi:hypothetical protein
MMMIIWLVWYHITHYPVGLTESSPEIYQEKAKLKAKLKLAPSGYLSHLQGL